MEKIKKKKQNQVIIYFSGTELNLPSAKKQKTFLQLNLNFILDNCFKKVIEKKTKFYHFAKIFFKHIFKIP